MVPLSLEELVGYLTTRSTVLAAVGADRTKLESIRNSLMGELAEIVGTEPRRYLFGGDILFYGVPAS